MKVEFYLHTGQGNPCIDIVDFPEDSSPEDIEVEFQEWKAGLIDASRKVVEGSENERSGSPESEG